MSERAKTESAAAAAAAAVAHVLRMGRAGSLLLLSALFLPACSLAPGFPDVDPCSDETREKFFTTYSGRFIGEFVRPGGSRGEATPGRLHLGSVNTLHVGEAPPIELTFVGEKKRNFYSPLRKFTLVFAGRTNEAGVDRTWRLDVKRGRPRSSNERDHRILDIEVTSSDGVVTQSLQGQFSEPVPWESSGRYRRLPSVSAGRASQAAWERTLGRVYEKYGVTRQVSRSTHVLAPNTSRVHTTRAAVQRLYLLATPDEYSDLVLESRAWNFRLDRKLSGEGIAVFLSMPRRGPRTLSARRSEPSAHFELRHVPRDPSEKSKPIRYSLMEFDTRAVSGATGARVGEMQLAEFVGLATILVVGFAALQSGGGSSGEAGEAPRKPPYELKFPPVVCECGGTLDPTSGFPCRCK